MRPPLPPPRHRDGITAEPGPLPDSVFLCFSKALEQTAAWRDGLFHLQGAASQLAAAAVCAKPGDTVLDACAAPGSKSFTMAQQMRDRGEIYAFDLHPHRVRLIEAGMRPAGHCLYPARGRGRGGTLSGIRTCRRGPCGRALLRLRDDGPPP